MKAQDKSKKLERAERRRAKKKQRCLAVLEEKRKAFNEVHGYYFFIESES